MNSLFSKVIIVIVLFLFYNSGYASFTIRSHTGKCQIFQTIDGIWTATTIWNDQGRVVYMSGTDCDGLSWTKKFPNEMGKEAKPDTSIKSSIKIIDGNSLNLMVSKKCDYRILNVNTS